MKRICLLLDEGGKVVLRLDVEKGDPTADEVKTVMLVLHEMQTGIRLSEDSFQLEEIIIPEEGLPIHQ